MSLVITPKNWKSFQHYTDRKPAWIKLHRAILDDYDYWCLPVASRALAPCLWLLASEYDDGKIVASLDALAFRFRMTRGEVADALAPLIEKGFFNASEPLADCKQDAIPEREEETEKEREEEEEHCPVRKRTRTKKIYSDEFEKQFWNPYPRTPTMSKQEAWRAWVKLDPGEHLRACKAIEPYRRFLKSKPNLETVHAVRFLSQRRFDGFLEEFSPTPVFDIRSHLV